MDGIFNSLKMEEITEQFEQEEMSNQKVLAIVGLITEILFFLPVASNKESAYAKEITNQTLTLFVYHLAQYLVLDRILGYIPFLGGIVSYVVSLAIWALFIIKIVEVCQCRLRKLPFGFSINVFK